MANRDAPMGLKPAYHLTGGTIRVQKYTIVSAQATSIFTGDLVKQTGTSKGIEVSTAGDSPVGVFAGCRYRNVAGETVFSRYWPTATVTLNSEDVTAYVYDDPDIVYEIQTDSAGTGWAVTDAGIVCDLIKAHTGQTSTGYSRMEANTDATGNADFMILNLVDRADNAAGTNADIEVLLNLHAYQNAGAARFTAV